MIEVLQYLRANGYRTYIVTGGGQEFVRVYAQQVYGIPPEQIIGSALAVQYTYDKDGGLRKLHRRPADVGVHPGRRRRSAHDAGAARRRQA